MLITSLLGGGFDDFGIDDDCYKGKSSAAELKERLRKTLRYGRNPAFDRSSLPLTELAVELLHDAAPRPLGKLDMHWASRISRRATVSPCAMILGLIYIERLRHKNPDYLQRISSSDLFLISMMAASKYLYDEGVTEEVFNDEWAESADMDVDELNEIEREFLGAIDWSLYVHADDFWSALDEVEQKIAWRMWHHHDVLTYLDLDLLSRGLQWRHNVLDLITLLSKVLTICSVAYAACTTTVLASPSALDFGQDMVSDIASAEWLAPTNLPTLPLDLSNWFNSPEASAPNISTGRVPEFLSKSSIGYGAGNGLETLVNLPTVEVENNAQESSETNQTKGMSSESTAPRKRSRGEGSYKQKIHSCLGLAGLLTLSVLSKSVMVSADDTGMANGNHWCGLEEEDQGALLETNHGDLLLGNENIVPLNSYDIHLNQEGSQPSLTSRLKLCKKCQTARCSNLRTLNLNEDRFGTVNADLPPEHALNNWRILRKVEPPNGQSSSCKTDDIPGDSSCNLVVDGHGNFDKVVDGMEWLKGQGHLQWLSRFWMLPSTYCS